MQDPEDNAGERADELLRRALIDVDAAAAVALKISGLPLSDTVTVIFHGRQDLGTLQTYVAPGRHSAGDAVGAGALLRVPCDLDLADAEDREEAERLYAEQAAALRDALVGADTVLDIWRESLRDFTHGDVDVDRSIELGVRLPAPRLMPVALVARDHGLVATPVCGARTLAAGKPPLGIAVAQLDLARVYPLPDDPDRCIEDFFARAAEHAHVLADQIAHQEASVQRFLELSGEGPAEPA